MGLEVFDKNKYKKEYLPQRLQSLEACVLACYSILDRQVLNNKLNINLGSHVLNQPDISLFVNVAIDSGLLANRALLNFMGIKLENHTIINADFALNIKSFDLLHVDLSSATKVLEPDISHQQLKLFWVESLQTASKSIAHFTHGGATVNVARLGYACFATSMLVRKYFYDTLSLNQPESIIPEKLTPKNGIIWDAINDWEEQER